MQHVALLAFRHRAAEVSFLVGRLDRSLLLLTGGIVCQAVPENEVLLSTSIAFELQLLIHTNAAA